jgi:hypothetical protein
LARSGTPIARRRARQERRANRDRYTWSRPRNAADRSLQRTSARQWTDATRARPKITNSMPDKKTMRRARKDMRQGKAPSTQAGEFVREEIEHVREGKHGVRSTKQAIAIGLSKARRAGVKLRPPAKGRASEKTRRSAASAYRKGQRHEPISAKRSRARVKALKREPRSPVSRAALSRQARSVARRRGARSRSAAAHKAAQTRSQRLRQR